MVSIMSPVETMREAASGRFHVRMVAEPSSVPTCRRFVEEGLSRWGRSALVDDVALCVSELSTNATLHGSGGYFDVELRNHDDGVRLVVVDSGRTPARTIATRAGSYVDELVLGAPDLDVDGMTGRGLFIVSALASAWGIEDTELGTEVWADFAVDGAATGRSHPQVESAVPEAPLPPEDWSVVRLLRCPPGLLLAHDENLADIVRELQLMGRAAGPAAQSAREDITGVVARNAVTWDAARLEARGALQSGAEHVDIAVLSSGRAADEVARLRRALTTAERLADEGVLMTLPVPAAVQRLRDWMEEAFVAQTVHRAEPVPFPDWLSAHS